MFIVVVVVKLASEEPDRRQHHFFASSSNKNFDAAGLIDGPQLGNRDVLESAVPFLVGMEEPRDGAFCAFGFVLALALLSTRIERIKDSDKNW
jgi:hypothetical protein